MNILLALIPVSIVLLGVAIATFLWAVRRGQFDDLDTPPLDILGDDAHPRPPHGPDRDDFDAPPDGSGGAPGGDRGGSAPGGSGGNAGSGSSGGD